MSEQTDGPSPVPENAPSEMPSGRGTASPRWRQVLFGAFVVFSVLFFLGALLYRFGSMSPPSTETRAAYAELESSGQVPQLSQRQFHIPIPGCVCHSDDPVVVIQHEDRRISECMGCHGG